VDAAAQFAKGGGGPPVTSAIPAEGAQGSVNLQVLITGSGFDSGSNAVWLRDGAPAPDVQTNVTTFVNKSELIADINSDVAALESLDDIEVTTRRGKNGIGTELFSVKKAGDTGPTYSVDVTKLGTLFGATRVIPAAISSSPGGPIHIVGDSNIGMLRQCSLLGWASPASPNTDLPLPTCSAPLELEPIVSGAYGVSKTGFIAGKVIVADPSQQTSTFQSRAVLWTPDGANGWTVRDLHEETFGALGAESSSAEDVNDAGQVIGGSSLGAFVWDDGQVVSLPVLGLGVGDIFVGAINNAREVRVVGFIVETEKTKGKGRTTTTTTARAVMWTVRRIG